MSYVMYWFGNPSSIGVKAFKTHKAELSFVSDLIFNYGGYVEPITKKRYLKYKNK